MRYELKTMWTNFCVFLTGVVGLKYKEFNDWKWVNYSFMKLVLGGRFKPVKKI